MSNSKISAVKKRLLATSDGYAYLNSATPVINASRLVELLCCL